MTSWKIDYKPAGPVTSAFLSSDDFVRGIRGPIGSGKSTSCVMEIISRIVEQTVGPDGKRRSRWAIIRNTYAELRTTTIKTWEQWVPRTVGSFREVSPPTHSLRFGDVDAEVIFLALDRPQDIAKLLSLELTGAWINEARELPKAVLDALTGRVGRYPAAASGGAGWFGIIMDTNPPDADHWWYRLAEESGLDDWSFYSQPSGLSDAAENLHNLPVGYYKRAAQGKEPGWVKVYVHGEYGFVRDGKPVYPEYIDRLHYADDVGADKRLPLFIGIDFGLTPAATFAQRTPSGRWLFVDELVTEDMGAKRFGDLLASKIRREYDEFDIEEITGDPAGDIRAQTDENTPFLMLRTCGVQAYPASTNDAVLRREAVATSLMRLVDGHPGFVIGPRCKMLRKGMAGGFQYRRVQVTGEERYRDVPDKNIYSHVCESAQYLMLGGGEGDILVQPKWDRDEDEPREDWRHARDQQTGY